MPGSRTGHAGGERPYPDMDNRSLSICVFCGSHEGNVAAHKDAVRRMARAIGERGWTLVYGGGALGLMGELARESVAAGARVIGVRPDSLRHIEMPMETGLEIVTTADLFERKKRMIEMSDAFVALPGGIGTLDELFEVVTTAQLGLHAKPVVVVNTDGFFDPILDFVRRAGETGFVYRPVESFFKVVATPEDALAFIQAARPGSARRGD